MSISKAIAVRLIYFIVLFIYLLYRILNYQIMYEYRVFQGN